MDEIKTTVVQPEVTPATPTPTPTRAELLRDISKEYGINLFDAEGVAKFKEFQEHQKTELQKTQEKAAALEAEKAAWTAEKLAYESKLKAGELGIHPDYMEDALKLAGGDPTKLADVVKKYPIFKAKGEIKIGFQDPKSTTAPSDKTEAEAYMANDPRYRKYQKQIKK